MPSPEKSRTGDDEAPTEVEEKQPTLLVALQEFVKKYSAFQSEWLLTQFGLKISAIVASAPSYLEKQISQSKLEVQTLIAITQTISDPLQLGTIYTFPNSPHVILQNDLGRLLIKLDAMSTVEKIVYNPTLDEVINLAGLECHNSPEGVYYALENRSTLARKPWEETSQNQRTREGSNLFRTLNLLPTKTSGKSLAIKRGAQAPESNESNLVALMTSLTLLRPGLSIELTLQQLSLLQQAKKTIGSYLFTSESASRDTEYQLRAALRLGQIFASHSLSPEVITKTLSHSGYDAAEKQILTSANILRCLLDQIYPGEFQVSEDNESSKVEITKLKTPDNTTTSVLFPHLGYIFALPQGERYTGLHAANDKQVKSWQENLNRWAPGQFVAAIDGISRTAA